MPMSNVQEAAAADEGWGGDGDGGDEGGERRQVEEAPAGKLDSQFTAEQTRIRSGQFIGLRAIPLYI